MNKLISSSLLIPALVCLLATSAKAQVDLTLNPIGLLFGDISIGADFLIKNNFSIEGAVGFGQSNIDDVDGTNLAFNALGKYYFSPKLGADRFYADVFVRYINRNWNYEDDSDFADLTSNRLGVGFGVGYKVVSAGGFVFDFNLGAGRAFINNNEYEENGIEEDVDWPELMIYGKIGLGYRFGGKKK